MSVSVQFLKGVKGARAAKLEALGCRTLDDLAMLLPRGYEDRTNIRRICDLREEDEATVTGLILTQNFRRIRKNLSIIELNVSDGTGNLAVVIYNQEYSKSKLEKGEYITFYGKVTRGFRNRLEMCNPVFTVKEDDGDFSEIKPVYPLTEGISQNILRKIIRDALSLLPPFEDDVPKEIIQKYNLMPSDGAIRTIHRPGSMADAEAARIRLAFDELLKIQLMLMLLKGSYGQDAEGIVFPHENNTDRLTESLPFALSDSQKEVWAEIQKDMESPKCMNRLVLGDVGSGKTILAVLSMLKAISAGYQAAYMAPTEILAEQHYKNISPLLEPFGIRCVLLTGGLSASARKTVLSAVESGDAKCVIGTHALIQDSVKWHNPGLVITDEQHRFGVRQRSLLASQNTKPDILVMTATPIPRTLGLILYGDMDISRIEKLPSGRLPVRTLVENGSRRDRIYKWIIELTGQGQQAYIVHPLVEKSENPESELISAEENYENLSKTVFAGIPCGLIHGRMNSKEKEDVMRAFASGDIKILFATTVIEVGVDVPNATVMIIENAERFGLAQLHQLRGRVGRGKLQSYCILFPAHIGGENSVIAQRMNIMKSTTDGFVISEKDLELRGPGDFFGTAQHGLPEFKVANLYEDTEILKEAQEAARIIYSDDRFKDYLDKMRKEIPTVIAL